MSKLHSINQEQGLYVINAGDGVSCLGFDYAEKRLRQVLAWLPVEARPPGISANGCALGSEAHYNIYLEVMAAGRLHHDKTGERCPAELSPQLIGLERKQVEVRTPSGDVSRFYVGKSTGWLPCHLEIKTRRSSGGPAVYIPEGAQIRVVGTR